MQTLDGYITSTLDGYTKQHTISFRCNKEFKEGLERCAEKAGISAGELIRECVYAHAETILADCKSKRKALQELGRSE